MSNETTTTEQSKKEENMKAYGYTPLIRTILHGAVISESVYLIADYWSSYLKAASNFATNNMNMFNTTILPQLKSGYQNIVNNPITSAIVTTGVLVAYILTDLARKVNYGEVTKTGYYYGEKNIQNVFDFSKKITLPTTIIAGVYSTISGTVHSWPLFNSEIMKNTSQVAGNYSALFTTLGIGAIVYSSEPLVKYLTNITRGVYEKSVMVKEFIKDVFGKEKVVSNENVPEQLKIPFGSNGSAEENPNSQPDKVKKFEKLSRIKKKFSIDLPKKNKN